MNAIQVLIIDDHPLIRLGVKRSMEGTPGLSVAGECADVASTHEWLASNGKANIAILDRSLPDGDGLDLVPALKAAGMKVIVLTVEEGDEEIRSAIQAGVDGYLLKSSDTDQISHAIGVVLQDAGAFPPQVLQKLYRANAREDLLTRLSSRELDIAECVAQGYSNKVIGAKLNLSDNTVRNHLANIMQKLNFHNRVQVATLVLQQLQKNRRG
jgi:DNA-binding NarL/FixJ family response regulator